MCTIGRSRSFGTFACTYAIIFDQINSVVKLNPIVYIVKTSMNDLDLDL